MLVRRLEEREKRRITQQEISDATGLRRPTVSSWMNWGTFKRLDADVVARLAQYFGCEVQDLFEWITQEPDEQGQGLAVAAA